VSGSIIKEKVENLDNLVWWPFWICLNSDLSNAKKIRIFILVNLDIIEPKTIENPFEPFFNPSILFIDLQQLLENCTTNLQIRVETESSKLRLWDVSPRSNIPLTHTLTMILMKTINFRLLTRHDINL